MDEQQIIKEYRNNKSAPEIAKMFGTYPNKILRVLHKHNEPIRDKSSAQKVALEKGRSTHPTKGTKISQETREKISEKRHLYWKRLSEKEKEKVKLKAKKRWEKMSPDSKAELQRKANEKLRETSKEGSAAEKYVYKMLQKHGYDTIMHKTKIGGEFEVDLFVKELNTAIEIDGPQHFLPVFGQEGLNRNIKADSIKNGLLIGKGFFVVRVKYLAKKSSLAVMRNLWKSIHNTLQNIENGTCSNKLIEIEVS